MLSFLNLRTNRVDSSNQQGWFGKILLGLALASCLNAQDAERAANTIILEDTGVENLQIETVFVEEQDFESTVFAIGRIEEIPANRSVLSSRIAGRVVGVEAYEGDTVKKGDVVVTVESRVAGNPPPTIELKALQGGIIVDSHVRLGEPVDPNEDLLDIADRSKLWAVAKIPESDAGKIGIGSVARIRVPALGEEHVIEAKLTRFGVEADREAGAIEGIFELDNSDLKLQPGMRTEFSIITGLRKNVMAVPRTSVQGDPTKRVVFVKDFELKNAFVRVPVVLGEQNDTYVEVIRGLLPADEVVTKGSYSLSFAGAGSISLKEALDAAHGHEHNEDGSELTAEQKAAREAEKRAAAGGGGGGSGLGEMGLWVAVWAGIATVMMLVFGQMLMTKRGAKN